MGKQEWSYEQARKLAEDWADAIVRIDELQKELQQWKTIASKLHDSISEYMEGEEDINESDIRVQSALQEYEALTKQ